MQLFHLNESFCTPAARAYGTLAGVYQSTAATPPASTLINSATSAFCHSSKILIFYTIAKMASINP